MDLVLPVFQRLLPSRHELCRSPDGRRIIKEQNQRSSSASYSSARHSGPILAELGLRKVHSTSNRLRAGRNGDTPNLFATDADFTWYNNKFTTQQRCGGGGLELGCGQCPGKTKNAAADDFLQWDNVNPSYLAGNKCKLRNIRDQNKNDTSKCSCPEKDALDAALKKKGEPVCSKSPCFGTDCLIKAFKEAQEFVDSIGKVSGLAGLGLVESPYFGTTKSSDPKESKKGDSRAPNNPPAVNTLCSMQTVMDLKKPASQAAPGTMAQRPLLSPPKKAPLVQEGLTNFPDTATFPTPTKPIKKKEEKIEKSNVREEAGGMPGAQVNEESPCGNPTCKSRPKKVTTECPECPAVNKTHNPGSNKKSKSSPNQRNSLQKAGPRLSKTQYIYSFGNSYPASVYGHKKCNMLRNRVPGNMGWLWNEYDAIAKLKPPLGWKPGAISLTLRDLLKEAKEGFFNSKSRPRFAPLRGKASKGAGKLQKTMSLTKKCDQDEDEEIEFPPTLHIHRKDGVYYVTMYPIRGDAAEARVDEPVNPLQFKIVKSKGSIASSSTASDMEIEFSPPAAVNRLKKKPNVVHVDTQVKQQEIVDEIKKLHAQDKKQQQQKKGKGKK